MELDTRYLGGTVAASTLRMYQNSVTAYNEWCKAERCDPVSPQSFSLWRTHLVANTPLAYNSIARSLSSIRSTVNGMAAAGLVDDVTAHKFARLRDPSRRALKDRLPKSASQRIHLTKADILRLVDLPGEDAKGLRDRALLLTMATSGVRAAEVSSMRYDDLRTHDGWHSVRVCGKDDTEPRSVPVAGDAVAAIYAWQRVQKHTGGYIFTSFAGRGGRQTGRSLTTTALWKLVRVYGGKLGIDELSPHDLRRYVGTQITRHFGLVAASEHLGHSSPNTTARYYQTGRITPGQADALI